MGVIKLHSYQEQLYRNLVDFTRSKESQVIVVAATTGFGKTELICRLAKENPTLRILILPHGQTVLRDNFQDRLKLRGIDYYTLEAGQPHEMANEYNVVCSLPQTIHRKLKDLNQFDIMIIDEAHQYYGSDKKMYRNLLNWHGDRKQILLTASHYNLNFDKLFFSREAALSAGAITDPEFINTPVKVRVNSGEYNSSGDLKEQVTIFDRGGYKKHLLPVIDAYGSKTMMVSLHSEAAVNELYQTLQKTPRWKDKVTRDTYRNKGGLSLLKAGKKQICLVVYKGILGFDYKNLEVFIDCSFTQNINRIDQSFGRIVRHPDNNARSQKTFIKIVPSDNIDEFIIFSSAVIALGNDTIYRTWDGNQTTATSVVRVTKEDEVILNGDVYKPKETEETYELYKKEETGKFAVEPTWVIPKEEIGDRFNRAEALDYLAETGEITKNLSKLSEDAGTVRTPALTSKGIAVSFKETFGQFNNIWNIDSRRYRQVGLREGLNKVRSLKYSYQKCLIMFKDCKSRKEIEKLHAGAYHYLHRNKLLDKLCKELGVEAVHSYEKCLVLLKDCKSRIEIQKLHNGAYQYLRRNKLLDKLCKELRIDNQRQSHSYEKCLILLKDCKSRKEMEKLHNGAYQYLRRNKLLDKLCIEMGIK